MYRLRFRQVHLDFHTSEAIDNIGKNFDKKQFQQALKTGHVDSITMFAKCHHGWAYYDSQVCPKHPGLKFDLLRQQFDACKEIDVNVPVYLSAGYDEAVCSEHPEWVTVSADLKSRQLSVSSKPAYKKLCFNSPYVDYLCEQIEEVLRLFPDCNGIFLDIIHQDQCVCDYCKNWMKQNGISPENEQDRKKSAEYALNRYYEMTTEAVRSIDPNMPVFHNSGNIQHGNWDVLKHFSHLELESLPTGGWGYDHFPLSAKYCKNLPYDFLGMTGKFHTTWGEFGGYKHPNALKYECAAMLAYGAKCSVGDQLHPLGQMNSTTYNLIGRAFEYVEQCESFCDNVRNVAEIGLLSAKSFPYDQTCEDPDIGAIRILLEGHFLFDVIDSLMDFGKYKVIILPDSIQVNEKLKAKLDKYLVGGGNLLLTGQSGLNANGTDFLFDIGATFHGTSQYCPDYILPTQHLRSDFIDDPVVMYMNCQNIKAAKGDSLGKVIEPYFNRSLDRFCSHQHTPYKGGAGEYDCGVIHNNIMYLAHPVFSIYRSVGAVAYKDYVIKAIRQLLGPTSIQSNLPSTARLTLMNQQENSRMILHLLYANIINRGGPMLLDGGTSNPQFKGFEVIEELNPLHDIDINLKTKKKISSVKLQPQNQEIKYNQKDGYINFQIELLCCHQMVVLDYN